MGLSNKHDRYLFDGASSGAVTWRGDEEAPTGHYAEIHLRPEDGADEAAAAKHYGTVHLIIQEGVDGQQYVHKFPDQEAVNARLLLLERAWHLWLMKVADDDVVSMHRGFMRAMAASIGMPGIETEWSAAAQRETQAIVSDWLIENPQDVFDYMRLTYPSAYARDRATWEDVGHDLAHVIQRQGFAFTDAVGPEVCAAEMNRTALRIPPLPLAVVGGVIEVVK